MRQVIFAGMCVLGLAACTSIPLTSIPKLSALNPETMALEKVQLAVRVQEDFRLYRDGAEISMGAEGPLLETPRELELELVPSSEPLTPYLQKQERRGYRIAMFEVNPEDAEDIAKFREELLALKARSEGAGENDFSIAARARGCLAQGANPFQDLRMKLYLRSDANKEFFTLFKEQRLEIGGDGKGISNCKDEDEPNLLWTAQ